MGLKPDHWIRKMALEQRMIEPFVDGQVRDGVISYGLSSYGYDIRVADEFKIFQPEITASKLSGVQCILSQVWPHLTHRRDAASRALAELKSSKSIVVDPKAFDADSFADFKGETCIIPPNSFVLGRTVEYFRVPRSVLTVCVGKSSYARCGIIVNVTPFEPEWEGYVTIEISNTTPLPAKIYGGEGIAQVIFFEADEECDTSYADRKGKYQHQQSIVLPRL
jgi:dCTP deaminase